MAERLKRRKDPRSINLKSISIPHPLGIKPQGNSLLNPDTEVRAQSLGYLSKLDDETIMTLLSYLDIESLKNFMYVSKVTYAFTSEEEIWRRIYTENFQSQKDFNWKGSWKKSILGHNDIDLKVDINSDVIYRPFQVRSIDYTKLFGNLVEDELNNKHTKHNPANRIPRFQSKEISTLPKTPFILTDGEWPQWKLEDLVDKYGSVTFTQESVKWDLKTFSEYLKDNIDESPLYLFDCRSEAMKSIRKDYQVPELFRKDYFKLLGDSRPDHSWIIIGSKRSGSTFHKDPNNTSAWNIALQGRKFWVMIPPNITPPGVMVDDEESEVTSPLSVGEWILSGFYNDALKIPEVLMGITFPGECMYVPSNWWHLVINLDDSIAITENFVPDCRLHNVLSFFKDKPNQISGFKLSDINDLIDKLSYKSPQVSDFQQKLKESKLDLFADCGELESLPDIPIFDIFKQLLIDNGYEKELNDSMNEINKTWNNLTSDSTTFKFNFE